jgi:hypothetical protein
LCPSVLEGQNKRREVTGPITARVLPFAGLLIAVAPRGNTDVPDHLRSLVSLNFVEPDGHADASLERTDLEFRGLTGRSGFLGLCTRGGGHGVLLSSMDGKNRSQPNPCQHTLTRGRAWRKKCRDARARSASKTSFATVDAEWASGVDNELLEGRHRKSRVAARITDVFATRKNPMPAGMGQSLSPRDNHAHK